MFNHHAHNEKTNTGHFFPIYFVFLMRIQIFCHSSLFNDSNHSLKKKRSRQVFQIEGREVSLQLIPEYSGKVQVWHCSELRWQSTYLSLMGQTTKGPQIIDSQQSEMEAQSQPGASQSIFWFSFSETLFIRKMKNVGRSRVESTRGKQRLVRCMGLPIHDGPARQHTKDKMS